MSNPNQSSNRNGAQAAENHQGEASLVQPSQSPRRAFLKGLGAGAVALGALPAQTGGALAQAANRPPNQPESKTMTFTLPDLPYAHDALQPYMSKETLEYHHDKHHLAYVTNGNNLLKGTEWEGKSLEDIVKGSFGKNAGLFNNAGQHYNHMHFWKWMKPNGGGAIPGKVEKAIIDGLGSVDKMKEEFIQAGVTQFGSGWCWLAVKDGKIIVAKSANGESPLVAGAKPILGCDVWEHSYYIDYRNRRPDYLKAFIENLVNWSYVEEMYEAAIK